MHRVMGRAADRLLSLVAPKATASAQTDCWIAERVCVTDGLNEVQCRTVTCCQIGGSRYCHDTIYNIPPRGSCADYGC